MEIGLQVQVQVRGARRAADGQQHHRHRRGDWSWGAAGSRCLAAAAAAGAVRERVRCLTAGAPVSGGQGHHGEGVLYNGLDGHDVEPEFEIALKNHYYGISGTAESCAS